MIDGQATVLNPSTPPSDWKFKTLGDAADIWNGGTPSTQVEAFWNGRIPWCTPTDITGTAGKYLCSTERAITKAGLDSCSATLLPTGSLLLCSRATIGEVKIAAVEACTNQGFKSLVAKHHVSNEFLYYLVLTLKPQMIERATGSTFLEINKRDIASIEIALPEEIEQVAIAEALSDVDGLLAALDALIAKKRAVKRGAMQELLSGETRLPGFKGEWMTRSLGEIGSFTNGRGITKGDVASDGVPCIRYGELYTHHHDFVRRFYSFVPRSVAKQSYRLRTGDLLFAGSGETREEIGKCAAYLLADEAYAGGDIVVLRPLGHDPKYLGYLMNTEDVCDQKSQIGQGDAVVHIYARDLSKMRLRLPNANEQVAIATVPADMDAEIEGLERRREKTRQIKQAMMQELLTGRTRLV